ncbi:hypothetical protein HK101_000594 [Irineochytrium annulatum]|nr:hypothetical protein HK101_000594 [Irineochytrium annulatum]
MTTSANVSLPKAEVGLVAVGILSFLPSAVLPSAAPRIVDLLSSGLDGIDSLLHALGPIFLGLCALVFFVEWARSCADDIRRSFHEIVKRRRMEKAIAWEKEVEEVEGRVTVGKDAVEERAARKGHDLKPVDGMRATKGGEDSIDMVKGYEGSTITTSNINVLDQVETRR